MSQIEYVAPDQIEARSFEIISNELEKLGFQCPDEKQALVIKRVIHTTADFDYRNSLYFSPGAVDIALEAIRNGAHIVTDTNMGKAGVSKTALAKHGGEVHCFMADPDIAAIAKERGITRATASMEKAASLENPCIFAIGNAPTALITLCEMYQAGNIHPAFVIGAPVGFVNVEAAKELLEASGIPCIIAKGRKGGSNVAAAICNALLYQLGR